MSDSALGFGSWSSASMGACHQGLVRFFEYNTPQIVHIQSKKIGIGFRIVQFMIITYVIGYVILYRKGYQQFSELNSSVTTKLKGVVYPNFTDEELHVDHPQVYRKVWDVADYVIPAQEKGAFFVMTNAIITPNQTQGICPEDPGFANALCDDDNDRCEPGKPVTNGNGVMTGNCISAADNSKQVCEIRGWCPVEQNLPLNGERALLEDAKHFTVLIKNDIEFSLFKVKRRNILNEANSSYLANCFYDKKSDPYCPIFKLDYIAREAQQNFSKVAIKGGVIAIIITWDCNLDFDPEEHCFPVYQFSRLDNPDAKISSGWNFRYAHYYEDNRRTLYKAHGIRFSVGVQGRAGKFHVVPLLLNVGSGLALLGISVVICDFVVLNFCKKKQHYYDSKFIQVK